MAKICIDPGHGGKDPGGSGLGRKEKNDVLEISLKIRDLLTKQGVQVVMTRETDKDIGITARCDMANKAGCDYFLSVHRDAFSDSTANGASMYIYSKATDATKAKAEKIYNAVLEASGLRSRGVKKGAATYTDYGVNRQTSMPSGLLELGFITNADDNDKFTKHIDNIALAITQAICEICSVNYAKPAAEQKAPAAEQAEPVQTDVAYIVQAGAFADKSNADKLAAQLKTVGFDAIVKLAGDINSDGEVTTDDARDLLRKAVGVD